VITRSPGLSASLFSLVSGHSPRELPEMSLSSILCENSSRIGELLTRSALALERMEERKGKGDLRYTSAARRLLEVSRGKKAAIGYLGR
jgi:hypothetical protein